MVFIAAKLNPSPEVLEIWRNAQASSKQQQQLASAVEYVWESSPQAAADAATFLDAAGGVL
jgi:hypothetical protein